jgi:Protein of unknown function (DUF2905)
MRVQQARFTSPRSRERSAAKRPGEGNSENPMARTLLIIWLVIVAVVLLWPWLNWLGLGRFRVEVVVESGDNSLYFLIVVGVLISIALPLTLWLSRR